MTRNRKVVGQGLKDLRPVANVAERLVAVEAEKSAPHLIRRVVVIDVFRVRLPTPCTPPALRDEHPIDLGLTDSVARA
jgi:hypothetical protein